MTMFFNDTSQMQGRPRTDKVSELRLIIKVFVRTHFNS